MCALATLSTIGADVTSIALALAYSGLLAELALVGIVTNASKTPAIGGAVKLLPSPPSATSFNPRWSATSVALGAQVTPKDLRAKYRNRMLSRFATATSADLGNADDDNSDAETSLQLLLHLHGSPPR